jgi:hypothetical protein
MKGLENLFLAAEGLDKRQALMDYICKQCKLCHLQEDGFRHIGGEKYNAQWVLIPDKPTLLWGSDAKMLKSVKKAIQEGTINEPIANRAKKLILPIWGPPFQLAEMKYPTPQEYLVYLYAVYLNKYYLPLLPVKQRNQVFLDIISAKYKEGGEK